MSEYGRRGWDDAQSRSQICLTSRISSRSALAPRGPLETDMRPGGQSECGLLPPLDVDGELIAEEAASSSADRKPPFDSRMFSHRHVREEAKRETEAFSEKLAASAPRRTSSEQSELESRLFQHAPEAIEIMERASRMARAKTPAIRHNSKTSYELVAPSEDDAVAESQAEHGAPTAKVSQNIEEALRMLEVKKSPESSGPNRHIRRRKSRVLMNEDPDLRPSGSPGSPLKPIAKGERPGLPDDGGIAEAYRVRGVDQYDGSCISFTAKTKPTVVVAIKDSSAAWRNRVNARHERIRSVVAKPAGHAEDRAARRSRVCAVVKMPMAQGPPPVVSRSLCCEVCNVPVFAEFMCSVCSISMHFACTTKEDGLVNQDGGDRCRWSVRARTFWGVYLRRSQLLLPTGARQACGIVTL